MSSYKNRDASAGLRGTTTMTMNSSQKAAGYTNGFVSRGNEKFIRNPPPSSGAGAPQHKEGLIIDK